LSGFDMIVAGSITCGAWAIFGLFRFVIGLKKSDIVMAILLTGRDKYSMRESAANTIGARVAGVKQIW